MNHPSTLPPITRLRVTDLLTIAALVETGSQSAVARSLGVTPSALSKLLRRLEGQVGLELFKRTSRALIPTEAARRIASFGRDYLQRAHGLTEQLTASHQTVRLHVASVLLDPVVYALHGQDIEVDELRREMAVLPPSEAPFELGVVPEGAHIAPGWDVTALGTVEWTLWGTPGSSAAALVSSDALEALRIAGSARVPRLSQALSLANRTGASVWASSWARHRLPTGSEALEPAVAQRWLLLCHPSRVQASAARRVVEVLRACLELREALHVSDERGAPVP